MIIIFPHHQGFHHRILDSGRRTPVPPLSRTPQISDIPAAAAPPFGAYAAGGVPDTPRLHPTPCTLLACRNVTIQCVFAFVIMFASSGEPQPCDTGNHANLWCSVAPHSLFPSFRPSRPATPVPDDASSNSLFSLNFSVPFSFTPEPQHIKTSLLIYSLMYKRLSTTRSNYVTASVPCCTRRGI